MRKLYPVISRKGEYDRSLTIDLDGFKDLAITIGKLENNKWQSNHNENIDEKELIIEATKNLYEDAKGMIKEGLLDEIIGLESDENCICSICRDGSIIFVRGDVDGSYWFYYLNEMLFNKSRIGAGNITKFKEIVLRMVDIDLWQNQQNLF